MDNGKEFEPDYLIACPKEFQEIPPFGINIGLAGVDYNNFNVLALFEFLKRHDYFKMNIIYSVQSKYFVELFNDNMVSLNSLLNSRFQNQKFSKD